MIKLLSKKRRKPTYVYDENSGMMKRITPNSNIKKRAAGSKLCCASPIIITKSVDIGQKEVAYRIYIEA